MGFSPGYSLYLHLSAHNSGKVWYIGIYQTFKEVKIFTRLSMLNQSFVLAEEISPIISWLNIAFISLMTLLILLLVIAGSSIYRDVTSYQRQGKRWTWYRRPPVIGSCAGVSFATATMLMIAEAAYIIPDNLFTTAIIFTLLAAGLLLNLYNFTLLNQKKE